MRAMLKAAGADIFDHIRKTPGREFTLRLSAVEIYNEVRAQFSRAPREACRNTSTFRAKCDLLRPSVQVVRDMLQEETPTLRCDSRYTV